MQTSVRRSWFAALVCAASVAVSANSTRAGTISAYDFEEFDSGDFVGTGTLSLTLGRPTAAVSYARPGTSLNAIRPLIMDAALKLTNSFHNNTTLDFSFSTRGLEKIELSFAAYLLVAGNGFTTNRISYATTAGGAFTSFGNAFAPSTNAAVYKFDFSSVTALNDAASATLRITLGGATSVSDAIFFDNVQIAGTPIPPPASTPPVVPLPPAALAGVALLATTTLRRCRRASMTA